MNISNIPTFIIGILALFTSCRYSPDNNTSGSGGNSIYYWRTTFTLNVAERDFLKEHAVNKIYVRFFDVDSHWQPGNGIEVIPQGTIKFVDSIPDGVEIVPTVYITTSAMGHMQLKENLYAEKIYKRINAMCRQNGILFNEIQLDCDWTKGTRKPFFSLCEELKSCMESTQSLSSTIRLHQLVQTPPPVDRGVLMVYNTGNLMEMTTDNSIFSQRDIEPYLRDNRLADYRLPLDVAYPAYGWSVVFYPVEDKYKFDRLMRRTDFSSFPALKKTGRCTYEATAEVNFDPSNETWDKLYKGYRVKVERPSASEIIYVKKLIDQQLNGRTHANIIYHLDESQFKHYSDNEINQIYYHN
ncbi:MAG: hypothetical protein NC082_05985 [Clostridiales bacterium]|nr:hypothetical protein [Clostridiales bacterium]